MTAPLTNLECELLEAVPGLGEDRAAREAVLGGYWIKHVDEVIAQRLVELGVPT